MDRRVHRVRRLRRRREWGLLLPGRQWLHIFRFHLRWASDRYIDTQTTTAHLSL